MKTTFQVALLTIAIAGGAALQIDRRDIPCHRASGRDLKECEKEAREGGRDAPEGLLSDIENAENEGDTPDIELDEDVETPELEEELVVHVVETPDVPDTQELDEVSLISEEEEVDNCDALDGTDSDAEEYEDLTDGVWTGHILKYALWVETSYIPREACKAEKGERTWGYWTDTINDPPVEEIECLMDDNDIC